MFSFVDSRTLVLLAATQVILLALVKCQDEDIRKLPLSSSSLPERGCKERPGGESEVGGLGR